jgi:decaprenylphospho-beta-D-ribofuranose 2-oxidase
MAVPHSASAVVQRAVQRFADASAPAFLAVLKRFGPAGQGHLSFPMPGWTLALDLPTTTTGLGGLLDRLDDEVAAAGGRVYLVKDARLRHEHVPVMYPGLAEWRAARDAADPAGVFRSDLARRLNL